MKTNFIKQFMLLTSAFAVAFGMTATTAFAAAAINTASNDLKTVRVSNYSAVPGSMTWGSTVNSAAEQIVSVGIYYHNSGDAALQNLKVRLSPQNSGSSSSHSFTATLSADNAPSVTDSATVTIVGGNQSLSYIPTAVFWYPNQACKTNPNCQPTSLPLGQNGSELFGSGLNLGAIAPGWATQGGLTVQFKVSNNGTNSNELSVTTYEPSGISDTSGSATLKGYVNPNGSTTTAWFKYRRNGGSWNETSPQSVGTTAQNYSQSLSGLASGDYEYQAVAKNSSGTVVTGTSKYFTLDGDTECTDCDSNGDLEVDTLSATNIDSDSATLRGDLVDDADESNDIYFEWGTSSSNLNKTLDAGSKSSNGSFSKTLSGLNDDTRYYFRACAENDTDEDCGSIESFETDREDRDNDDDAERPDVTTLNAFSIGSSTAIVDGYFEANGCSVTTYFQYGRTNDLGSTTASVNRGNGSGSMSYQFTVLAPNTTYYYRAVATNCEGTTFGTIKSFTTANGTVVINPVNPGTAFVGTGGGSQFIKLMIDNNRNTVRSGTDIIYDLSWENVTRSTIKGLILEVNFDEMTALDTDMGDIARDGHSVIVELDDLGPLESGEMTITTKVSGSLKEGDPIVAQAIMAFENPKTSASENAIAYDSDEFTTRGSALGASIFGLGLPTSLAGWLLILLIILVIIILARYFIKQNQAQVVVRSAERPVDAAPAATNGNDYIVYRPTPKQ